MRQFIAKKNHSSNKNTLSFIFWTPLAILLLTLDYLVENFKVFVILLLILIVLILLLK